MKTTQELEEYIFKMFDDSLFDNEEWDDDCGRFTATYTCDDDFVRLVWDVDGEHAVLKKIAVPDGEYKDPETLKAVTEVLAEYGYDYEDDLTGELERRLAKKRKPEDKIEELGLTPALIDEKNVTTDWITDFIDSTYGHGYSTFEENGETRLLFFFCRNHKAEIIYYSFDNCIIVKSPRIYMAASVMNDLVEYFYGGGNNEYEVRREPISDYESRISFYHLPHDVQKIDFRGEVYTRWQFDEKDYDCYPAVFCDKSHEGEFVPYYDEFLIHAKDGFFRCPRNCRQRYTEI